MRSPYEEWEKFANTDPFYAVLHQEEYRTKNLSVNSINEFYESGERDFAHILKMCRVHIEPSFDPGIALDYGCGVGRMTKAATQRILHVNGADLSDGMINKARGMVPRATFFSSDCISSCGRFDFIFSHMVFQHIPVEEGMETFEKLIALLNERGIAALHFTYKTIPHEFDDEHPDIQVQMNEYSIPDLLGVLAKHGITHLHMETIDHDGQLGVWLYFQKL